ncbi:uncharacterized protein LOC121519689 isoform X2 [Cheilinus undulatus]|uniref:uncharacterized protein LOC121519689 isoform X2 n=1 Tax=Cheilinus undulatus TaxID=241271 RepID=UPI001BD50B52|nr:uncharacterized protein LOC121519689 isoform X2 [Cheilinus undulatus]
MSSINCSVRGCHNNWRKRQEDPSALTPVGGRHCSTLLSGVEARKMADYEDVRADGNPLLSIRITEVRSVREEMGLQKTGEKIPLVQTPEEEDDDVLEVPLTQPAHLIQPTYEAKPSEDAGVMLLKTPVVWSPHTVKAAVSRLSAVQPAQSKTSPPVPSETTQENNSDTLPKATVTWSPVAVKAAVNRISEKHQTQPTQPALPSPLAADKLPADDALKSTMPTEQSSEELREERRREIKIIQNGRYRKSRVLSGPWRQVGGLLLRGRFQRLPKALMQVPGFRDHIVAEVLKELDKECETLTSAAFNSALRENDPAALKDFSWDRVIREWKTTAPTFLKFLRRASKVYENQSLTPKDKSLPMAMGGALLLRARSPCMCAPQYINSMILRQGGTKKRCVSRLNRLGLCMSNRRSLLRLKDAKKSQAPTKQKPEETDTEMPAISEENRYSNKEEEDSDVPEITYIVS